MMSETITSIDGIRPYDSRKDELMPNHVTDDIDDRLARMEQAGRRCDANSRHCARSAVDLYTLLPADGDFNPLPGAEPVLKKSCGFHRAQFLGNGVWKLIARKSLSRKLPKPPTR